MRLSNLTAEDDIEDLVQILNAKLGASYAVMSIQGKVIASGKITSASHAVMLPNKGMYLVKVGSEIRPVSVK